MSAKRKQIWVGYHPSNVIEAAERWVAYVHHNGESWASRTLSENDTDLLLDYCEIWNPMIKVEPTFSFHQWVLYLLASEYTARAFDVITPGGIGDAVEAV